MRSSHATGLPLFLIGNVFFAAGLFVHVFLFNFYLRELGLPPNVMGFQAAAITSGGLLALMPVGFLIDRVGVRTALLLGVMTTTAGLAITALARTPLPIYAAAALIGVGGVTCRVTWGPALMRLTQDAMRRGAFSWNAAILVGTGAGWTALAGVLPDLSRRTAAVAGLSGIQLTLLGGAAVTALAALCYLPLAFPRIQVPAPVDVGILPPRDVRVLLPLVALWMLASALVLPFFNVFFHDRFNMPVARVGALFAMAHGLTALVLLGAAEVPRRTGLRRPLIFWMLVLAPALWGLAATSALGWAVVFFFIQGIVGPATNPLIDQMVLELTPAERHGVVASWRNAAAEISGAVGASAGGLLLQARSFSALFVIAGVVAALSAAALTVVVAGRGLEAQAAPDTRAA